MRFSTFAVMAASAATALATSISNPFSPIPGYPLGNGFCLSDQQATFLVNTFAGALANTNRPATNATMQVLITNNYAESSDSINALAGFPLGSSSFTGKTAYIASLLGAPPTPPFQTFQIFHDCTNIAWRWEMTGLAENINTIKGISQLVANPLTGQLSFNYLEFNSIAWGRDIGWTCTPPPGQ